MAEKNGKLHIHHRQRLKKRFMNEGLDNFEPHNVLELLLFFGIPQGDTNDLAHELLNKFGSVANVLNAEYDELLEVKGIGEHSATLLKLIPELFNVYLKDKAERASRKSYTVDDAANHLVPLFLTCEVEVVRALFFDNRMDLVEDVVIYEGDVNSANFSYNDILKMSINRKLPNVIISHNHPNGTPLPSVEDIQTTANLKKTLEIFGVNLVEHILISGEKYTKILKFMKRIKNDK